MNATKLVLLKRVKAVIAVASGVVVAAAVTVVLVDYGVRSTQADEQRDRLDRAEEAARMDLAAAEPLAAEVERQTDASLVRTRRQQIAGTVALVALAVCMTALKSGGPTKPGLPTGLARRMPVRQVAESEGAASAVSHAVVADIPRKSVAVGTRTPVDCSPLLALVGRIGREERHLIPLLHAIEEEYHFLPAEVLERLCELTDISAPQVAGVASFYRRFRTEPRGRHVVQVCRGTACHVTGADRVLDELRRCLRIPDDADTDPAGDVTVETVGCLGCCTLAPVVQVDDQIEGKLRVESVPAIVEHCRSSDASGAVQSDGGTRGPDGNRVAGDRRGPLAQPDRAGNGQGSAAPVEIRVGLGSCCVAGGSQDVLVTLERELAAQHRQVTIKPVGCVGICHLTPLVEIVPQVGPAIVATRATPADVRRIVRAVPGKVPWQQQLRNRVKDLWPEKPGEVHGLSTGCRLSPITDRRICDFTDPQVRIVTEHSGEMSPTSLEEYRQREGFVALATALLSMSPDEVIQAIKASGLRGRGGGGFPTAQKWQMAHDADGEKYVVCNGDEGDPGAFMDRMIMESYAYRVLEGLAIAAYAVGAQHAVLYIRHEYVLAVKRVRSAIEQMSGAGLLGDDILGSGFSLHVELVEGAGAFVCGEETALIQSVMGQRGTPQFRPPYPVERGLRGRPTLVNNVETLANVPWILRHGPERFAGFGTATSAGTKVFSLAGKVRRGGLVEVPMGLTLREVVETIGGGVRDGKQFKAVQIGGPSGGCVPAALAETRIDYEALRSVGAIMGSGGLVVMDEDDCMVDVARYFLEFTQQESCGHCTFCRVGTRKLLDILEKICAGRGSRQDLEELESLSQSVVLGSLCGLGKTAPNPVLTTLKYFREEYEAHLAGRCPAGRCKALIKYEVTHECVGCTLCAQHCPVAAIPATPYRQHLIDDAVCTRCDVCRSQCPEHAIKVV